MDPAPDKNMDNSQMGEMEEEKEEVKLGDGAALLRTFRTGQ